MNVAELSAGQLANLASVLEVSAPKPGNVHRGADFDGTTFQDFLLSAAALGHVVDRDKKLGVGQTILNAVEVNQTLVGQNTNLGIVLLLVPLCKAEQFLGERDRGLRLEQKAVAEVLEQLTRLDAELVFRAIQIASPGGLKSSEEFETGNYDITKFEKAESVSNENRTQIEVAENVLLDAMRVASSRDMIANQYAHDFETVFDEVVPCLVRWNRSAESSSQAIVFAHLEMMSRYPDSLIGRKCGLDVAEMSAVRARKCLAIWETRELEKFWCEVSDFDFWLRSDGNRRNPGTTADLIAAGLFVALRNGLFQVKH